MKDGFTLIELVAVLALVSVLAVFSGHLVSVGMGNYFLGVESAERSQARLLAQQRLIREINWAEPDSLEQPDANRLRWRSSHPDRVGEGEQTLTWDGEALLLNGRILLPEVTGFSVSRSGGVVQLSVDGWNSSLYPRLAP